MDVLALKPKIDQDIYYILKLLQIGNNPIKLMGSANIASQKYFSDYDLFSPINKMSSSKMFKHIYDIFYNSLHFYNLYFIELKIQLKDGEKFKIYNIDDLNEKEFNKIYNDIDFIKFDFVFRIHNKFTEISIIYGLGKKKSDEENKKEAIKSITDDMNDLYNEGNYYKFLKRKFALLKLKENIKDKSELVHLSKLFNSEIGALYAHNSNLKALELLAKNYNDTDTIKKIKLNLKDIKENIPIKDISKKIKQYDNIINEKAKQYI